MDGIKIPILLLVIVIGITAFMFYTSSGPSRRRPVTRVDETDDISEIPDSDAIAAAQIEFNNQNYEQVLRLLEGRVAPDNYEGQRMLAYSFAAEGRHDAAIVAFENALALRRVPELAYSLAYMYELTGRTRVARILYEEVLTAELPPRMLRGAHEGLARTSHFEQDLAKSFNSNREIVMRYPDSVEGFISLFQVMKKAGRTSGLENLVRRGDQYHINSYEYNYWLAVLYFENEQYDAALNRFRRCIRIDPDNSTPYYYSYRIFRKQNNLNQALDELAKYQERNPLLPHVFFNAAIDAKNAGRLDLAYRFMRSALTRDRALLGRNDQGTLRAVERMMRQQGSSQDRALFEAFMNFVNGDHLRARQQAERLLPRLEGTELADARMIIVESDRIAQQDESYARYMAQLRRHQEYERMAQLEAARLEEMADVAEGEDPVAALRRNAMNNPNDLRLQYSTGLELARRGHISDAKSFLNNAIRINPNIMEPHFSMARIYLAEGDDRRAREFVDNALAANPSNSQTLSLSANLHFMSRDLESARRDANSAIRSNPNNAEARKVLAQIYLQRSEFDNARSEINRGLRVARDPQLIQKLNELKGNLR